MTDSPTIDSGNRSGASLVARNITKEYVRPRTGERVLAIENLDVTINNGEFVSLVGPSGCGKSTFLSMVNGLVEPSSGVLELLGRPIAESDAHRGTVFQDASLFPWYSVRRNISYGLECLNVPKDVRDRRVGQLLETVGLTPFQNHFPHELSGGMQQRVNLARALAVDPAILLMDEPFAALDAQTREIMQGELLHVWEQSGKTVLFITHDIGEAIYLADRVLVMSARPGRILDDIVVPLDRPRPLAMKHDAQFIEIQGSIWNLLESEARRSMSREDSGDADAG